MGQQATKLRGLPGGIAKPRFKLVTVTPTKAEAWLKKNVSNRHIRDSHVARLGRDMEHGRWDINGVPIIFANDMTLLDGQHRLMACVRSGCPFTTLVAYDVHPDAMKNIDIGIKRFYSDRLKLEGVSKNHKLVASLTSAYHEYSTGGVGKDRATYNELSELYDKHAIELVNAADWVASVRIGPSGVNPTAAALAYMLMSKTSPRIAEEYIEACITGESITRQHPAWTVRRRVQSQKEAGTPLARNDHFALIARGWNALRSGRTFSKTYTRGKGQDAKTWREIVIRK